MGRCVGLLAGLMAWSLVVQAAQHERLIIEAEDLLGRVDRSDLVLVDVRPADAYARGHLPGAVSLPMSMTYASGGRSDLVAPISAIQQLFSTVGIRNTDSVVLYDGGDMLDAARVFWVFEVFGHVTVAVLNGGLAGWQSAGGALVTAPVERPRSMYLPTVRPNRLATAFSTRMAIDNPERVIVDSREPDEYEGFESIARRYGHIPSAINRPWRENLVQTAQGVRVRPLSELRDAYSDVARGRPVIAYCNKGKEAALTYFVLRQLGYDVAAYDGSWYEWGNDPRLPVTSPHAPGS